jgi:hypothetical protein
VGTFLGRGFRTGDDVARAEPVAVLSFGLWLEMGGNPSIIGTRVTLDGTRRTVIGVLRRGFWFPDPSVRIWMPEPLTPESRNFNSTLVGRVAELRRPCDGSAGCATGGDTQGAARLSRPVEQATDPTLRPSATISSARCGRRFSQRSGR